MYSEQLGEQGDGISRRGALVSERLSVSGVSPAAEVVSGVTTVTAGSTITDINAASLEELRRLVGIGAFYANRIIRSRPYRHTGELVEKRVLPPLTFDRIKEQVCVGVSGAVPAVRRVL